MVKAVCIEKEIYEPDFNNFKKYGSVISLQDTVKTQPALTEKNFEWWGRLEVLGSPEGFEVGILRLKVNELVISKMERHKNTQEILIPIDGKFIMPVSCHKGESNLLPPEEVKAFYIDKGQIMILKPGIWHCAPFPLKDNISTFILFQQGTVKNDLEFRDLKNSSEIVFIQRPAPGLGAPVWR
jgi:ureidoglycolate hydrolase